ncbi:endonuclease domain-containing protein [Gordonia zhaorongruii]|uniref:endonuclease domain-containing protein n=1 Tax=Gordonia zhaorongruii TaxID=2597659 RepID=UPI001FD373CE|nr:DUF559 domain-containing protein [Gordonia zhaorongruii]
MYARKELAALGYDDDHALQRAIRAGDLVRLRIGWYAFRVHDRTVASAVRDGGVSTCVDALRLHDLWVPPTPPRLHLRRGRHRTGKHVACRPCSGSLRSATRAVDPVPVALKYAVHCLDADEWIAVCDSYMNSSLIDPADLRADMGSSSATVRRLLDWTDRRSQSGTESITRVRLKSLGYSVVVQPGIEGVGWADLRIGKLILECDSRLHHSSKAAYERDHHRDRRALVDGWLVMRLTYDDVLYGWDTVLEDIRAITTPDRHRARTVKQQEMLRRSARISRSEGNLPFDLDI